MHYTDRQVLDTAFADEDSDCDLELETLRQTFGEKCQRLVRMSVMHFRRYLALNGATH